MDYITKIITDLIVYRNYSFWMIKKSLETKGIIIDKAALLKRIKQSIDIKNKFKITK